MIKSVTITNHLGDNITLELMRPEKSGFVVKSIDGLGPVKASISMSSSASCDGSVYNSAFMITRDIKISLLYYQTTDETIEDIRQKSYKYFPNKQKIRLLVETDNRTVWTEGYVEDNQPNIFSDKAGCTITIRCPDPYLYSTNDSDTLFYGVVPIFEFPLENTSTDKPLLDLGMIVIKDTENVYYEGDGDIGCTIVIDAIGPISNISIYRTGTLEYMAIDTDKLTSIVGSGIDDGDTIVIETSVGRKSIELIRDGIHHNILNCLDRNSTWFMLSRGDNVFNYVVGEGEGSMRLRISNKIVYYGV